jgi:peptide/nickel transport system permease protein
MAWLALVFLSAVGVESLPLPAPDAPDLGSVAQPPLDGMHWLGTDPLGRDVLSGLLYGARTTCLISIPAALLATLLGTLLGSAAGYWGNHRLLVSAGPAFVLTTAGLLGVCFTTTGPWSLAWLGLAIALLALVARLLRLSERIASRPVPLDAAVLLLIALLTSVPRLILVLAVAALQPPSMLALLAILVFTYWPVTAQLMRAEMQRVRQLTYMEAARALGLPHWRMLGRHALPALWTTLKATLPLSVATLIGLETTLSFLGVGLPPETASWGRLLASARQDPTAWWLIIFPGGVILLTTLALRQLAFSARSAHK